MHSCLIACRASESAQKLKTFLSQTIEAEWTIVHSGNAARQMANGRSFDFFLIHTPLPDEFGFDLAIDVTAKTFAQALVMVAPEQAPQYTEKGSQHGVYVLSKPVQGFMLQNALLWMSATYGRLSAMQSQNDKLQKKLEDLRLIDRAKCLLISSLGMDEEQAHKHIERQAMDMRTTKTDVAKRIIQVYQM